MRFVVQPWVKQITKWLFKNRKRLVEMDASGGYESIAEVAVPKLPDGVYACCRNMSENGVWDDIAKCRKIESVAELVLNNAYAFHVIDVKR